MKEEIISTAGAAAIKSAPPVTVAGALAPASPWTAWSWC